MITVEFHSRMNDRRMPYRALVPSLPGRAADLPVLFLLHGLFGSFENWTDLTRLREYVRGERMLIVCPEGGDNWYADDPAKPHRRFGSYILEELLPDVEERFQIVGSPARRAVAGLSMGGYGAFKLTLQNPELFCFAASMSGAFDVRTFLENRTGEWSDLHPSVSAAFEGASDELMEKEDIFSILEDLPEETVNRLPFFYFDCGLDDPLLGINRKLSSLMRRRGIVHRFVEAVGGHDWDYWDRQGRTAVTLASEAFAGPPV